MKKIFKFGEWNSNGVETLHIFDFDDTLVKTPSFEELAIQFLKEDLSISDLLQSSCKRIGISLNQLRWENGRIFIENPNGSIKPYGNWVEKGKRLYLITPNAFQYSDLSLPTSLKEFSELYLKEENKCIVTARPESLRPKIIDILEKFGLGMPKYGLHMAPDGQKNLGTWKGHKIVEIVNELGFQKAIFYDDNPKYIKNATRVVKEKLPNLDFKTVKVK
jgi:hypothetical protein